MALHELDGSPTETYQPKFSGVRRFICPWSERYTHRNALLNDGGAQYPYDVGLFAFATRCAIEGMGRQSFDSGSGLVSYENAILTVTYDTPEAPTGGGAGGVIITEDIDPHVEFVTLDHRRFIWEADGKQLQPDESPGTRFMGVRYTQTRKSVPQVKQEYITYVGRINTEALSVVLTSPPLVYPAESVLYAGAKIAVNVLASGQRVHDISLNFLWSESPTWNKFLRMRPPVNRTYDYIKYFDGASYVRILPYGSPISFNPLIT